MYDNVLILEKLSNIIRKKFVSVFMTGWRMKGGWCSAKRVGLFRQSRSPDNMGKVFGVLESLPRGHERPLWAVKLFIMYAKFLKFWFENPI